MCGGEVKCIGSASHLKKKFGKHIDMHLNCANVSDSRQIIDFVQNTWPNSTLKEHSGCRHRSVLPNVGIKSAYLNSCLDSTFPLDPALHWEPCLKKCTPIMGYPWWKNKSVRFLCKTSLSVLRNRISYLQEPYLLQCDCECSDLWVFEFSNIKLTFICTMFLRFVCQLWNVLHHRGLVFELEHLLTSSNLVASL